MTLEGLLGLSAGAIRERCRRGEFTGQTVSVPPQMGFAVANLVALQKQLAFDFFLYAQRNPQACPILAVTEPGSPVLAELAPGADLRTDFSGYRVYRRGCLEAGTTDVSDYWDEQMVGFLLGCSCTVDHVLRERGVPLRSEAEGRDALFLTNRATRAGGIFRGPLVVSVRAVPEEHVATVVEVTGRFPRCHGGPVHIGDPSVLGIRDLQQPDWGHGLSLRPGEVPIFHACGVTPQMAALESGAELVITHAPSHMIVLDAAPADLMDL